MGIASTPAGVRERLDALAVAHIAFVTAMALHAADHVRQPRGLGALTPEVFLGGIAPAILAVGTLPLTLRRRPPAPPRAAPPKPECPFPGLSSHRPPNGAGRLK